MVQQHIGTGTETSVSNGGEGGPRGSVSPHEVATPSIDTEGSAMALATEVVQDRPVELIDLGGRNVYVVDTNHGRWLLDIEGNRYLGLPSGAPVDITVLALGWHRCERIKLDVDTGRFAIVLDDSVSATITS